MNIIFSSSILKRINRIKEDWETTIDFIIRVVSDKVYELERDNNGDRINTK